MSKVAIILAGGEGSRLGPKVLPKPLSMIVHTPVINFLVDKLLKEKIEKVYVITKAESKDRINFRSFFDQWKKNYYNNELNEDNKDSWKLRNKDVIVLYEEDIGSSLFCMGDFDKNFLDKLQKEDNVLSNYLKKKMKQELEEYNGNKKLTDSFKKRIVDKLNEIIETGKVWNKLSLDKAKLSKKTKGLIKEKSEKVKINRSILEDHYPYEIAKSQDIECINEELTGTLPATYRFIKYIEKQKKYDHLLILNGDNYFEDDLQNFIETTEQLNNTNICLNIAYRLENYEEAYKFGVIEPLEGKEKFIKGFKEKPKNPSPKNKLISIGCYSLARLYELAK